MWAREVCPDYSIGRNLNHSKTSLASMDKQVDRKKAESVSCPFRRFIQRQVGGDVCLNKNDKLSSTSNLETSGVETSLVEMASTGGIDRDDSMSSEDYVGDRSSLLSLQPWIFRKGNLKGDWEKMERNGDFSNKFGFEMNGFAGALLSPRNKGPHYQLGSSRGSLRSKRLQRYFLEPLTSIESCFMPQLCNEHLRIDKYVFSSLPSSPVSNLRPFLITDGNRIISGSSYDPDGVGSSIPSETLFHKEANGVSSGAIGTLMRVPPLPESRNAKRKIREVQRGRLDASNSQRSHNFSPSEGSLDGRLLFCLGICIGVTITILSNRIEVGKLNKLLKHSEDLVRDLQEELEMKDSLTVKELVNEACESQEANHCSSTIEDSTDTFPDKNPTSNFTVQRTDEYDCQQLPRPGENPEQLSKIEAELEAELERLEQNISASNLQRRMSDLSEFDPELIGDIIHGELRADMLGLGDRGGQTDGNSGTNGTSTTHTQIMNYSVSPKELSLRLHEVIQIRLEERIQELETSLLQSQRQVQFMEAERLSPQRAFSNSDIGSSSNQESPTVMQSNSALSHPLCLNLSGDALDTYDEAYKEFTKMDETENPPSSLNTCEWIDRYMLNRSDHSPTWELEGGRANKPLASKIFGRDQTWEQILWSRESSDTFEGGQEHREGDISDDEEGKKLIQQIVEKTRQGSPVVMFAQRMLSLMDEQHSFNTVGE